MSLKIKELGVSYSLVSLNRGVDFFKFYYLTNDFLRYENTIKLSFLSGGFILILIFLSYLLKEKKTLVNMTNSIIYDLYKILIFYSLIVFEIVFFEFPERILNLYNIETSFPTIFYATFFVILSIPLNTHFMIGRDSYSIKKLKIIIQQSNLKTFQKIKNFQYLEFLIIFLSNIFVLVFILISNLLIENVSQFVQIIKIRSENILFFEALSIISMLLYNLLQNRNFFSKLMKIRKSVLLFSFAIIIVTGLLTNSGLVYVINNHEKPSNYFASGIAFDISSINGQNVTGILRDPLNSSSMQYLSFSVFIIFSYLSNDSIQIDNCLNITKVNSQTFSFYQDYHIDFAGSKIISIQLNQTILQDTSKYYALGNLYSSNICVLATLPISLFNQLNN